VVLELPEPEVALEALLDPEAALATEEDEVLVLAPLDELDDSVAEEPEEPALDAAAAELAVDWLLLPAVVPLATEAPLVELLLDPPPEHPTTAAHRATLSSALLMSLFLQPFDTAGDTRGPVQQPQVADHPVA
jgi:hypothetical protein